MPVSVHGHVRLGVAVLDFDGPFGTVRGDAAFALEGNADQFIAFRVAIPTLLSQLNEGRRAP
jgi:hypothetical protein